MRHRVKALVTTASIAGLLLAGATPSHATSPAAGGDGTAGIAQSTAIPYDGRTLFAGLMLGYGPVADQFPELAAGGIETEDPQAAAEFVEVVTATVDDLDPTFFDHFERGITSGDRVQVDQALRSAGDLLVTAVTELDGSVIEDPRIAVAAVVAIAVAAVAVVTLAATVNTAANVNAIVNVNVAVNIDIVYTETKQPAPPPPTPESMPRIDHEKRVDQIAGALAG